MRTLYTLLFLLLSIPAAAAFAAPTPAVERLWPDAPRPGAWETLRVKILVPVEGGQLWIRDSRGGLWVGRSLPGSEHPRQSLLTLPLVNPAELDAGLWPLDLQLVTPTSRQRWHATVNITESQVPSFRVALADETLASQAPILCAPLTKRPLTIARIDEHDLHHAGALLFSGADALLLTPAAAADLGPDRVLALAAAGTRILLPATQPPPALEGVSWTRLGNAWIFPPVPLRPPTVINPALARIAPFTLTVPPGQDLLTALTLTVALAAAVPLLARGLFKRSWVVLLASALGLALVTAISVLYVQNTAPVIETQVAWTQQSDRPLFAHRDRFYAQAGLLPQSLQLAAPDDAILSPLAAEPHDYFAWKTVRFWLGGEDALPDSPMPRLTAHVPGRRTFLWDVREARPASPPETQGWTLDAGYILPRAGQTAEKTLFTDWARQHPAVRDALLAWYELRFQPNHRYLIAAAGLDQGDLRIQELPPRQVQTPITPAGADSPHAAHAAPPPSPAAPPASRATGSSSAPSE